MATNTVDLKTELQKYGIPEADIKSLHTPAPELLDYLDLIGSPGDPDKMPDCVVESQERPLLFVVNETLFEQPLPETHYHRLCHTLACRGNRSYLARIRPGELHVFPVETSSIPKAKVYYAGSEEALSFFPRLAFGLYDGQETPRKDFVFTQMLKLLKQVATELDSCDIEKPDILSLVGRALFFRFLCDRNIIQEQNVAEIAPGADSLENCFDGAMNTANTCRWLDQTFNGNFLPLSQDASTLFNTAEYQHGVSVFTHLSAIARAYEAVGRGNYQSLLRFKHWSDFDFAHIPVGLLSQVYEYFAHKWDTNASKTSVYYTPRNIASSLVDLVFQGMPEASSARVLDPACGAGVFLVLAFRRLYREQWKATGVQPTTQDIRQILMQQLTGFDISDSALKLAALSLYLTAIELDPNPVPANKLRFENLQDQVLFNWRHQDDPKEVPILGSLRPDIGTRFDNQYDIILSNPPWTSVDETLGSDFDSISKEIIRSRGDDALAEKYHNPDNVPDLPFLWKSTQWCRPNARIGMALPARILLKQEKLPIIARETLFRLIEVNGIINGSNLSKTQVWPEMEQPFMLLLATNRVPKKGHALHFITPHYDSHLNSRGEMWIDSESAVVVSPEASFADPWMWKTLTIGTSLDVDVIRKIKELNERPLIDYWIKGLGLQACNGYQIAASQSGQQDATALQVLPDLDSTDQFTFAVDATQLNTFKRSELSRTRILSKKDKRYRGDELAVYRAPLALIKKSPGLDRTQGRGLFSTNDIAYNTNFYGYSAHGHPEANLLARYLQLFAHSDIWLYYVLMTSSMLGAERKILYKSDFDGCPIVPLEKLASQQKEHLLLLSERLIGEDKTVFAEIDAFFAELYGLHEIDLQVIRDTLNVSLPYVEILQHACTSPKVDEQVKFQQHLESLLCPFFNVMGKQPRLDFWQPQAKQSSDLPKHEPYAIMLLNTQSTPIVEPDTALWLQVVEIASKNGATLVFLEVERGLAIAVTNQYRYWTLTRARLCAAEIIRRFMHLFED